MKTTNKQIKKLRELDRNATRAPWTLGGVDRGSGREITASAVGRDLPEISHIRVSTSMIADVRYKRSRRITEDQRDIDAKLIFELRNSCRNLLDDLDALHRENEKFRKTLNDIAAWHDGPKVTSGFDEPASASQARAALGNKPENSKRLSITADHTIL